MSHLDDGILWFTGNPLQASSDRPLPLCASGLSDEASCVFPVNHSMPSSNYNLCMYPTAICKRMSILHYLHVKYGNMDPYYHSCSQYIFNGCSYIK